MYSLFLLKKVPFYVNGPKVFINTITCILPKGGNLKDPLIFWKAQIILVNINMVFYRSGKSTQLAIFNILKDMGAAVYRLS